jgi:hypothetical protein
VTDGAAGQRIKIVAGVDGLHQLDSEPVGGGDSTVRQCGCLAHGSPPGAIKVPGSARGANRDRLTRSPDGCHDSATTNLTLLCRYHHHNFASKGWHCQINPDGLPEWRPPWWIDKTRTPMINTRIRSTLAARHHRRQ